MRSDLLAVFLFLAIILILAIGHAIFSDFNKPWYCNTTVEILFSPACP